MSVGFEENLAVRETLFYAMPSTSGRVTQFQVDSTDFAFLNQPC